MHGYKKGTPYKPITRYYKIVEEWSWQKIKNR
jgi:hypothetical protein